jgi:hypothetical protein
LLLPREASSSRGRRTHQGSDADGSGAVASGAIDVRATFAGA